VWASNELADALIRAAELVNNTAVSDGGGAMGGKLMNCLIRHNTAGFGGGASFYFRARQPDQLHDRLQYGG
jgi:hypothetical protein